MKIQQTKKIAVVLHGLQPNGTETLLSTLSQFIDPNKVSLTFLLAVDEDDPQPLEEDVKRHGHRVIHLHDLDRRRLFRWPLTLYRAFRQYGPFDGVHANMDMLNGLVLWAAQLAGIPLRICHAHSPAHVRDHTLARRVYLRLMRSLIRKNATVRLACSKSAGVYFYKNDLFYVLDNSIDLGKFVYFGDKYLDKNKQDVQFMTVGRIVPEKNPFFLLDVFEKIHEKLPKSRLTWVGDGRLRCELENRVRQKGLTRAVRFLGRRTDVAGLMKEADCFLFPSLFEAFGLALLEAQAMELECFASDTIPREVDCGKVAFLSLGLSPEAWAEEILRYIASDRRMELDYEKMHKYDVRIMARRLTKLYQTGEPESMEEESVKADPSKSSRRYLMASTV